MYTAIKAFIATFVTFFSAFVCVIIGFALNNDEIREYMKTLPENVEGFLYTSPIGDRIEGEILIQGVSKASGIEYSNGLTHDNAMLATITDNINAIFFITIRIFRIQG